MLKLNILFALNYLVVGIYLLSLMTIFFYSLYQLKMLFFYIRYKKEIKQKTPPLKEKVLPKVTIQLPLYNERYVIKRLLESITTLDYPSNNLQIQILDDSSERDYEFTKEIVKEFQKKFHSLDYLHRKNRNGFKAGALKEGLKKAKGDFIAIFDADFLPSKNWLREVIPHFNTPQVGAIQTRWGHINRNYSVFTWAQSLALDIHFRLEQVGRGLQNQFINFNGTAGIWRKSCIEDAGNWDGETLTEDLDLSYRAQLKNWKILYLEDIKCPAELPVMLSGIRSQQFRWNKGGAENFKKHIKNIWRAKNLSFSTKFFASLHLLNSSIFLFVFLILFLSLPTFIIQKKISYPQINWIIITFFSSSTLIFMRCFWEVHIQDFGKNLNSFLIFLKRFFFFYVFAMGLSFHNSWAVMEGYLGKKSPFLRTPKFDIRSSKDQWKGKQYSQPINPLFAFFEMFFSFYFMFGCYLFFRWGEWQEVGFLLLFIIALFGFGGLAMKSLKERYL